MWRIKSVSLSWKSTSEGVISQRQRNEKTQTKTPQPAERKSSLCQQSTTVETSIVQSSLESVYGSIWKCSYELNRKAEGETSQIDVGVIIKDKELFRGLSEAIQKGDRPQIKVKKFGQAKRLLASWENKEISQQNGREGEKYKNGRNCLKD